MPDASKTIPPAARALIAEFIDSVAQLELLLWLRARESEGERAGATGAAQPAAVTPAQAADALRHNANWVAAQMQDLARRGLLSTGESGAYRYQPATPAHRQAADELAATYAQRPVAVITQIFTKPPEHLRHFADAFRLSPRRPADKEPPNG